MKAITGTATSTTTAHWPGERSHPRPARRTVRSPRAGATVGRVTRRPEAGAPLAAAPLVAGARRGAPAPPAGGA
ncbi:MAG: hypothetical protein ACRD0L_01545, partial [Acidimicrobiales bacterium]